MEGRSKVTECGCEKARKKAEEASCWSHLSETV